MLALLAFALAAAPVETPRLAATGFTTLGVEPKKGQFYADYFADQLNATGAVRVVTQSEMIALLGAERQRQLLGCSEEGSCLAELAGALDARGVIIGSVALVSGELTVQLKVIAGDTRLLGLYSTRVKTDSEALDFLAESAKDLAAKLAPAGSKRSRVWLVPVLGGAALAIASAICFGIAGSTHAHLVSGMPAFGSYGELTAAASSGQTAYTLAFVFLGVAAVALVTGLVMAIVGDGP